MISKILSLFQVSLFLWQKGRESRTRRPRCPFLFTREPLSLGKTLKFSAIDESPVKCPSGRDEQDNLFGWSRMQYLSYVRYTVMLFQAPFSEKSNYISHSGRDGDKQNVEESFLHLQVTNYPVSYYFMQQGPEKRGSQHVLNASLLSYSPLHSSKMSK